MKQSIYRDSIQKSRIGGNPYDSAFYSDPKVIKARAELYKAEGDGYELQKFRLERELLERFQMLNFAFPMNFKSIKTGKLSKIFVKLVLGLPVALLTRGIKLSEKAVVLVRKYLSKGLVLLKKADAFVERQVMRVVKPLSKLKVVFQAAQKAKTWVQQKLSAIRLPFQLPRVTFSFPRITLPKIQLPKISLPKVSIPWPKVRLTLPTIKLPRVHLPKLNFKWPALPKVFFPKFALRFPKAFSFKRPIEMISRPFIEIAKRGKKGLERAEEAISTVVKSVQPVVQNLIQQAVNLFVPLQAAFLKFRKKSQRSFDRKREKFQAAKKKVFDRVFRVMDQVKKKGAYLVSYLLSAIAAFLGWIEKIWFAFLSVCRFVFVIFKIMGMIFLFLIRQMMVDAKHYVTAYLFRK